MYTEATPSRMEEVSEASAREPRLHQHLRRRKITTGIENNDERERCESRRGSMWEDRRKDYKGEEEAKTASWQTEKYMEITTVLREHKLAKKERHGGRANAVISRTYIKIKESVALKCQKIRTLYFCLNF